MAARDVTKPGVEAALEEFRRIELDAMLERYGGRPSTRWFIKVGSRYFDQKVLLRAAHEHDQLGPLPPRGVGRFNAGQAKRQFERLGYRVVDNRDTTNEDLAGKEATGPLMRWRIGATRQRTTPTYGEAAARLEHECGFGRIHPAYKMDIPVGEMQYRIRKLDPTAPLLHVLLVRVDNGEPGDGACEFLAERYPDERQLQLEDVRTEHPELWSRVVGNATDEVYRYLGWEDLYSHLYSDYTPDPYYAASPVEGDGVPRARAGEGPNHKELRLWVMHC